MRSTVLAVVIRVLGGYPDIAAIDQSVVLQRVSIWELNEHETYTVP